MNKVFIYILCDPRTGEVRYVGKTNDIYYRLARHISDAKRSTKRHKDAWLKGIINQGLTPVLEVIDECTSEDWKEVEIYWIAQLKAWNFKLLNETKGGDGVTLFGKNKRMKPIFLFSKKGNIIEEFDGYLDIIKKYPTFTRQGIQECCLGILKTYKTFIFLYRKEQIEERLRSLPRQVIRKNPRLAIKQVNF